MSLHTQVTPIAGDRQEPEEDREPLNVQSLSAEEKQELEILLKFRKDLKDDGVTIDGIEKMLSIQYFLNKYEN